MEMGKSKEKGERMSYVIAIANQKGGVAKTTTVVSLAGAFAQLGYEVLTVDLDPQGNLSLSLGVEPLQVRGGTSEVLFHTATILNASRETTIPGLDLLPANNDLEFGERFLPMREGHEGILRNALQAGNVYDMTLLDCPPAMGAITTNALVAANLLLIPTQPEYFSAHALRNMLTSIRQVREKYNPNLIYRILITMRDRRNRIHRNLTEQICTTFPEVVFKTIIDTDTRLRESSVAGLPIMYYRSRTRSAFQYQALAEEIVQYAQESVSTPD